MAARRILSALFAAVPLVVATSAHSQCARDQEQTLFNSSAGGDRWQSFTAGVTGNLCRVEINCQNPVPSSSLMIYTGEGTDGTVLHTQSVVLLSGVTSINLTAAVPSTAGSQYTMRFVGTNAWRLQANDVYAGGRSSAQGDYWFRTFVDQSSQPVPTISILGLFALALLVLGTGGVLVRRQRGT